ncbi:MAG TPA: alkaline phosphatase family protein, partial [Polyangiaceae bacterium]|nr:alkaline phosphatase family protein [Polyangiaceae bacterium]
NRVKRHTGVALIGTFVTGPEAQNRRFAITTDARMLPADKLKADSGSPFHGHSLRDVGLPVAFGKEVLPDILPEVLSRAGLRQFRCAETEKYAHVTFFFNGGREEPFAGEDRKLVPSPKEVATYDLKPEMSLPAVVEATVAAIRSGTYAFVLVNFANPDMVGHTGNLAATIQAIEAVDAGVGRVARAVREVGGALLVTADHGNAELMRDPETGRPHTAHTTNRVPFVYLNAGDPGATLREGGRIADVAPTVLALLGMPQPAAMTGESLLARTPA